MREGGSEENKSGSWQAAKPGLRNALLSVLKSHEDAVFYTWYGWTSRELTGEGATKAFRDRLTNEDPDEVARQINELSRDINAELDRLCTEYVLAAKNEFLRAFNEDRCLSSRRTPVLEKAPGFFSMEVESGEWTAVYYLTKEDCPDLVQLQQEIFELRMKRSKIEKSVLGS